MSLNQYTLNSRVLNDSVSSSSVIDTGEGNICPIIQVIGIVGEGQLISINQSVTFFEVGEGDIFEIYQNVIEATPSQVLIEIRQDVRSLAVGDFFTRNKYMPSLIIGNFRVPDSWITGEINITRTENSSSIMNFKLYPPVGVQTVDFYEGKRVQLYIATEANPTPTVMYTGYINEPSFDIVNGFISFSCSDLRQEQIENQLGAIAPYIGSYSVDVYGEPESVYDEITKRLETVPFVLNFNAAGQYTLTDLVARSTPFYTFDDTDVYGQDGDTSRDPRVQMAVRSRIINQVDVAFKYQYQRLYQRVMNFSWQAPYSNSICDFLINGYSVLKRSMVEAAVNSAGWPLMQPIGYVPVFRSGFYNCNGISVGWSTSQSQFIAKAMKDINGAAIKNAEGEAMYEYVQTGSVDMANTMCLRAAWNASYVWSQNISEEYSLKVIAQQSQDQYGIKKESDSIGVQSDYNVAELEKNAYHITMPSGSVTNGPDKYINLDSNITGYYQALQVALNRARTKIIAAHRDTRVTFRVALNTWVDLVHTIKLDCTKIKAQGKVSNIMHYIDCTTGEAYTEIEISVSRAQGTATSTPLAYPTRPTYTPPVVAGAIGFGSHYGEEPQASWTGHVGNKYVNQRTGATKNIFKTQYPETFVVETPTIEDATRANKELLAGDTYYNVAIQNDLFQIIFQEH